MGLISMLREYMKGGGGGGGNSNGTIEPSSTLNTLRDTMSGQIKH